MLRLNIPTDPYWLALGYGVRVEVRPFNSALMLAVKSDIRAHVAAEGEASMTPDAQTFAFILNVAKRAILNWEGVGDENGVPVAPTPDGIAALLAHHQIFEAFERHYVMPRMVLDAEKNGSSPAPNGTSAGALITAAGATAPAESAPTPRTNRKARKAGRSGT